MRRDEMVSEISWRREDASNDKKDKHGNWGAEYEDPCLWWCCFSCCWRCWCIGDLFDEAGPHSILAARSQSSVVVRNLACSFSLALLSGAWCCEAETLCWFDSIRFVVVIAPIAQPPSPRDWILDKVIYSISDGNGTFMILYDRFIFIAGGWLAGWLAGYLKYCALLRVRGVSMKKNDDSFVVLLQWMNLVSGMHFYYSKDGTRGLNLTKSSHYFHSKNEKKIDSIPVPFDSIRFQARRQLLDVITHARSQLLYFGQHKSKVRVA